jgi:hypothetical protein
MMKFMNLLSGKEENMMEKIRYRDGLGEMRDKEKKGRGAMGRDERQREKVGVQALVQVKDHL